MLNPELGTVLFQVANFLILAVALYFLLFRPVMRKAQERAAERERQARESERDRQEAERLRVALEQRLANVEQEAAAIITRAQEQAEIERAELLREAATAAERILTAAHANAGRMWRQAVDDFRDELVDAVLQISGQTIGQVAPPEVHASLIQQLSEHVYEMGRSEMQQVEALRRSLSNREATAYVATARPLTPEQQGLLARTFIALADRHVDLEVRVDPALAAGVRARLGDLIIDNTIADRLETLREALPQALEERASGA